jgi:hypothetical protein
MKAVLGRFGDRVLERLVPNASAQADSTFWRTCYCTPGAKYIQRCHTAAGVTTCEACYRAGGC